MKPDITSFDTPFRIEGLFAGFREKRESYDSSRFDLGRVFQLPVRSLVEDTSFSLCIHLVAVVAQLADLVG